MSYLYLVIGGSPFTGYTNTTSFTALNVVGGANSIERAKGIYREKYEECGGLLEIINTESGTVEEAGEV